MGYKKYFDENKRDVSKRAIATKIIDMIEKIELNNTELSARRWIWELIQNARDISKDKIDIYIDVTDDEVKFSHNGKPFITTHLLSLINQVSGKDRSDTEVVGRYGTGFITTSLLSKVVEVESLIKEEDEPLKKFNITLDRSSNDISTLSESIESTLSQLDMIDRSPEVSYSEGDITTVFKYILGSESSRNVARVGYEDLLNCIDYVLILQPKINKITLNGSVIHAEKIEDNTFEEIQGSLYRVYKNSTSNVFLKVENSGSSLIIPLEMKQGKYIIKETSSTMPRLFCEFPCVGTENFSLPIVLNNPTFFLTEPRDGVYLTNKQNKDVENNMKIIECGVETLIVAIKFMADKSDKISNIEKLLYLPEFVEYDWQSDNYIETGVINKLRDKASSIKFVPIGNKLYSLDELIVPDFKTAEMIDLAYPILDSCSKKVVLPSESVQMFLPLKNCKFEIFENIDDLFGVLSSMTSLSHLSNKLFKRNDELIMTPLDFINNIVNLCSKDEDAWRQLITLPVFPSLSGEFRSINEMWDLSNLTGAVKDIYIKASSISGINKEYTSQKYIVSRNVIHDEIDTTKLLTSKKTNQDALKSLGNCVLTLKSALYILGVSPEEGTPLYNRYKELCNLGKTVGSLVQKCVIEDYTEEYLEVCEVGVLTEILTNASYGINVTNSALKYVNDYGLHHIIKNNLHNLNLLNKKGGIAPINKIPAKNCYYSVATKSELEKLYFAFFPEQKGAFIDDEYILVEELFQPNCMGNYNLSNAISKKVLDILGRSNQKTEHDTNLLQSTYNYIQANSKDVESEFPFLKDKLLLLCSEEVRTENQHIVEKVRKAAKEHGMTVDEYLISCVTSKDNSLMSLFGNNSDSTYLNDEVYDGSVNESNHEGYNRARIIGALGEKMAYDAIVNYYIQSGYSKASCSQDGNTVSLNKIENDNIKTSITVKLFADNQQGYDIIISVNNEVKYYVEVKASVSNNIRDVELSKSQMVKASMCYWGDEEYVLVCITNIESNPKFNVVKNPFAQLYTSRMNIKASVSLHKSTLEYDKGTHTSLAY